MKTSTPIFQGQARNFETAVELAEATLGQKLGESSDKRIHFRTHGWCRIVWLEDHKEAVCEGVPSISLPSKFAVERA